MGHGLAYCALFKGRLSRRVHTMHSAESRLPPGLTIFTSCYSCYANDDGTTVAGCWAQVQQPRARGGLGTRAHRRTAPAYSVRGVSVRAHGRDGAKAKQQRENEAMRVTPPKRKRKRKRGRIGCRMAT